jgi:hypothetical protein
LFARQSIFEIMHQYVICKININNIFAVIILHTRFKSKMTKPADNYTDKRTGIVYTDVTQPTHHDRAPQVVEPHLDAFISESFLKNYFDNAPAPSTDGKLKL